MNYSKNQSVSYHQDSSKKQKKMKNRIIYIALVTIFTTFNGYSQETPPAKKFKGKVEKADKEYDKFAYVDAIETYERVFDRGYKSEDMLKRLGNAYYFKADLDNASKWYGELFNLVPDQSEPEYYYRYAQALKSQKEYKRADEMMKKFNEKSGNDLRGKLASTQKDYLAVIKRNSGRYTLENAGVNSENSDYGSAFYGDKVVFASARDTGGVSNNRHSWTGEGFTNLYSSDKDEQGMLSKPVRFSKKINSKYNESTPVFTKDGKTMYFTRNNFNEGKKGKDSNRSTLLKLYKATLEGEQWKDVKELPFNSDQYSTAHPALSPDEKTLYFASDMPGTLGLSDLFKVSVDGDTYGTPENLGPEINTEGRETMPFVASNNELYFASDGHPGLGGLDVFTASTSEKNGTTFKEVLNVGEPLNSSKDDFGYIVDKATNKGYVTSNREGGNGNDDIYKFTEKKPIERLANCKQKLSGSVVDQLTQSPIANAKVTLSDANFKVVKELTTDEKGNFDIGEVKCGEKFFLKTVAENYNTNEAPVVIGKETGETFAPIELDKSKIDLNDYFGPDGTLIPGKIAPGLEEIFDIKNIYFDLDKYNIRPDAEVDLAKILDVLEQHPTMQIDIRSHTDSRQTAEYNNWLSDNRAKSTMKWLIKKGINKTRLTAKGYGESQLVNKCADGVECTEEEHQQNRRSVFYINRI
jgi:outer membrane protein OmpA-like peptidoglycan-associated protein/tetratricopeptide (TPR) repeat protein